jgi:HK97 family phage major capsid protein
MPLSRDYPQSATDAAKRALKHKEETGSECGTRVGWFRAGQLARREALEPEEVRRTYSFLSRAAVYNTGEYFDADGKEVCGSVMYDAWGGETMLPWAKKRVEELDEEEKQTTRSKGNETMSDMTGIDAVVAKAVADAMKPLEEKLSKKATSNFSQPPAQGETSSTGIEYSGKEVAEGTGLGFIRYAKAKATAALRSQKEGRYVAPSDVAKGWGYNTVAKALNQNDFDNGGSLVHQQFASEMIELLRNKTVVRKAGPRVLPMTGGNLTIDRQSASATAYYGQESTAITPSDPSTEQIVLTEKKLTALTAVSNDLIRNASINAEEFVRDDLLNVMAIREDLAFLRGAGSASEPTGLRNRITSGHVYAETVSSEGSPTFAEIKAELDKAVSKLELANVPMLKPVWFMSPRTKLAIMRSAGPGAEGTNSLEREMVENGTLRGFPFYATVQIPTNLGSDGDESELYLVDMSEVLLGDSLNLEVEVFPNGAWSNSGTIVSGISNDQTVIRAISKHDIQLRHTTAGVVVTELSWAY